MLGYMKGISLLEMLFGSMHFVEFSYKSFIGCFGYMQYQLPRFIYDFYSILFIISLIGLMCYFIDKFIVKKQLNHEINKNTVVFYTCLIFCIIITICFSVYNSYIVDFQPQGRYCYPALPAIAFFFAKGFDFILKSLTKINYRHAVVGGIFAVLAFISWQMYNIVYLLS